MTDQSQAVLGQENSRAEDLQSTFRHLIGEQSAPARPRVSWTGVDFGVREGMRQIRLQMLIGHLMLLPFGYFFVSGMRFWGGYRIANIKEIRRQFREIVKNDAPLIICANHLTYIDSALIIWALAPIWWYALHFKKLSWNLPAGDHFKKKFIFRLVAYLSKCIFIHRDGAKSHKMAVLNLARHLVSQGHPLTFFPEGRRSRTGRLDLRKPAYGIGKIIHQLGRCRVLCIYMRADKQDTFSSYSPRGSTFHLQMETIAPKTDRSGRQAYIEYFNQVTDKIKQLEDQYFAGNNPAR